MNMKKVKLMGRMIDTKLQADLINESKNEKR
jgi:hypothetical protein